MYDNTPNEPGFREEIESERITRDEVLDAPVSAFTGDKRMIPVDEEHMVVTNCLVLVEEVVIDRDNQNRDDH